MTMRPPIAPIRPFSPEHRARPAIPAPGYPDPGPVEHKARQPRQTRGDDRLTPFLILKLTPGDLGQRPVMQALQQGMKTLVVAHEASPGIDAGFVLRAGDTYRVSGMVTNAGQSPALMGLAKLFIVDGATLTREFGRDITPPYDIVDFQAWPGQDALLRFRRPWIAPRPTPTGGLANRISVFIHVIDLSGDVSDFFLTNTGVERRIARRDFHPD
jgi:hypothetical protein